MIIVDSHTEGEPTRVVLHGGPDLGDGPLAERRELFAREHDSFRSAVINEPRGSDALVGALLCDPVDESCATGAIFFNNVGYLGMCGHATIGLAASLAYMGRLEPGVHKIETPVGIVSVDLKDLNTATIENVPSRRFKKGVSVEVEGLGAVIGDIAWGGNWFFLTENSPFPLDARLTRQLTDAAERVKAALRAHDITGEDGAEIDHVEFTGPAQSSDANSRNFVLCPGGAYDRSPCGTGTSAKLACLAADGKLKPGETWIQESVIGSRFEASYRLDDEGRVVPSITGRAFVTADVRLVQQEGDPFANGIVPGAAG